MSNAIISFGCNDERYKSMLSRLDLTLKKVEWTGAFKSEWRDHYYEHTTIPYHFKTMMLNRYRNDYRELLWLDTSMYPIKNPEPLFSKIDEQGYYFSESGFNCAQSVSDACLELFEISRDEAEKIKEVSSGCVGINMDSEIGRNLLDMWTDYTNKGGTKGSRFHDGQSKDPRFLFHRQDQSVLSLCAYKLGLVPSGMNEYWGYLSDKDIENKRVYPETCCLMCRGL